MTTTTATLDQLLAAGGSLWEKGDLRRIYFNNLADLFGLKLSHYNTGNVSGAELDGMTISNTEGKRIASDLAATKLWVDLATGTITVRESMRTLADYDYARYLTEALVERLKA
jgi:uncharacterized protein YjbI with pentapeptide repeats